MRILFSYLTTSMNKISRCIFIICLVISVIFSLLNIQLRSHNVNALLSTVYVNGTAGNDAYDGSSPTYISGTIGPKATIGAGISEANIGGTVHVAAGTYIEDIWIANNLTLIGADALTTIITHTPGVNEPVLQISTGGQPVFPIVNISGFTIQNGNNHFLDDHYGGGISVSDNCTAYLNICIVINNEADYGGGIYNCGTLFLTDCTISNNNAASGGAIYNEGTLNINKCCVSGNSAQYGGGGIYNNNGQVWLTNCTISGNSTWELDISGGGGISSSKGAMAVLNCTIAYNSTSNYSSAVGGGFYIWSDTESPVITFKNTIVANNTAGYELYNNGSFMVGTVTSLGNNIDSENSCGFDKPTDQINTNPQLGPLQNNGGPTSTCAISANSPAFNKGNNSGAPATDQRGVIRPQGTACDIGAFELEVQSATSVPPILPPKPFLDSSSSQLPDHPSTTPAKLSVKYLNVQPRQAQSNQPIIVYANIANGGDEVGTYKATLKINDVPEQVKEGKVGGHSAVPLKFEVLRSEPGTYLVDVNDQQSYFTIAGEKRGVVSSRTIYLTGFIVCAIGIVVVSVLLIQRRRNIY